MVFDGFWSSGEYCTANAEIKVRESYDKCAELQYIIIPIIFQMLTVSLTYAASFMEKLGATLNPLVAPVQARITILLTDNH